MALAVWEINEPEESPEWGPLRLRLLPDPAPGGTSAGRCRDHVGSPRSREEWGRVPRAHSGPRPERRGVCAPGPRTSVRARRLRVAAVLFVLSLGVLLALPVRAWAGQASRSVPAGLVGSTHGHPFVHKAPVERILLPG